MKTFLRLETARKSRSQFTAIAAGKNQTIGMGLIEITM
jgi:hypothetical protein